MKYRKFYIVKETIYSNYTTKNGKAIVYALSGSICLLVSKHDDIWICAPAKGDRFPVKKENIKRYFFQIGLGQFIHKNLKIES